MKIYEPGWISSHAPDSTSNMNVPLPAPVTIGVSMPLRLKSALVALTASAARAMWARRSAIVRMCCARP
jgi:hypothetical protein